MTPLETGIDGIQTRGDLKRFVEEAVLGDLPQRLQRAQAGVRSGTGSPEGAVEAPVGTLYRRLDGGAGSTLYVKESGSGSSGWVAK